MAFPFCLDAHVEGTPTGTGSDGTVIVTDGGMSCSLYGGATPLPTTRGVFAVTAAPAVGWPGSLQDGCFAN